MNRLWTGLWLGVAVALALTGGVPRKAAELNRDANKAFDVKKYDDAAKLYDEAQTKAPESPAIAYNLGNTLYREGKFGDAAAHLKRGAESTDPALRQRSLYNLGNALHDLGELQMASRAYRDALKLNPSDLDAKVNFEKTLQELKDHPEQQKQKQNQNKSGDSKQDQKNQQGQKNQPGQDQQDKQKSEQGEQDKDQQAQNEQGKEEKDKQGEKQEQQPGDPKDDAQMAAMDSVPVEGLSKEEAIRILEAMREQEKELQKQKARQVKVKSRRVDKDW